MSLTVTSASVVAQGLTSTLAQLPPAILQTQEKTQQLIEKTTEALTKAEARADKLEAELIETRKQQAAERAAASLQMKKMQEMIETLQKSQADLLGRMTLVEERAKVTEKSLETLITTYNGHTHGYNGPGQGANMAKTTSPGYVTYHGIGGFRHNSHACPVPKYDERKA